MFVHAYVCVCVYDLFHRQCYILDEQKRRESFYKERGEPDPSKSVTHKVFVVTTVHMLSENVGMTLMWVK